MLVLVIFTFTNTFLWGPVVMFSKANPGDISESWYNETTLNVTVLQLWPRINWYGFQYNNSGTWEDRLNQQIDVNNTAQYRFIVNISGDQGWAEVDFINITAWADNGSEATTYNQSGHTGGNRNLWIQYENSTGTGNVGVYRLKWPDDEVTKGYWTETVVTDGNGGFYFNFDPIVPDENSYPPNEYYGLHKCKIVVEKDGEILKEIPDSFSYAFSGGDIFWGFIIKISRPKTVSVRNTFMERLNIFFNWIEGLFPNFLRLINKIDISSVK